MAITLRNLRIWDAGRRTFKVNWDEFEDVNAKLISWEHRSIWWQ